MQRFDLNWFLTLSKLNQEPESDTIITGFMLDLDLRALLNTLAECVDMKQEEGNKVWHQFP